MNSAEAESEALNKPKLLIVDDNPAIVEILSEVGNEAGYHVASASNREEVEQIYPRYLPQVIFLDLGLEEDSDDLGEDGLQVCK
ncbi:MAG: response regulator, partial [Pseudomonadales bacterium]